MTTTPLTTAIVVGAALWVGFSAYALLTHKAWVVDNLVAYDVPRSWWPWLGAAKGLGAAGLVAGIWVPALGIAAAAGLVLYFLGAVATVLRARALGHVAFPLLYLVPAAAAGSLIALG